MYVVFEGVDCVGKSTQISLLKECFKEAIFTAEPGGTKLGNHLRELSLYKPYQLDKKTELLLFLVDRAQHYEEILKASQDKLIISDRSFISDMAYAKDFENEEPLRLDIFALENFFPQKVILLKGDENLIKERLSQKEQDAIKKRGIDHFLSVQDKLENTLYFLKGRINPQVLTLNANDIKESLRQKIRDFLQ